MRVHIKLFATLKDRAGVSAVDVSLESPATLQDMLTNLSASYPAIAPLIATSLVAINEEYATPDSVLADGDVIAIFPPVSGGSTNRWPQYFAITTNAIDLNHLTQQLVHPASGAICTFTGYVRGSTQKADGSVLETAHLEYEAYQSMAEKMMGVVAAEMRERWPKIHGIAIVQRIGVLDVSDTTVAVACGSAHRHDGCFEAAAYGIERLKEIIPVWKKEVGPDGATWIEGHYRPDKEAIQQINENKPQ